LRRIYSQKHLAIDQATSLSPHELHYRFANHPACNHAISSNNCMHRSKDSFDLRHGVEKQRINNADRRHLFKRSNIKSYSFTSQLSLCHAQEWLHEGNINAEVKARDAAKLGCLACQVAHIGRRQVALGRFSASQNTSLCTTSSTIGSFS
jgi:hypothetical protein